MNDEAGQEEHDNLLVDDFNEERSELSYHSGSQLSQKVPSEVT